MNFKFFASLLLLLSNLQEHNSKKKKKNCRSISSLFSSQIIIYLFILEFLGGSKQPLFAGTLLVSTVYLSLVTLIGL